MKRVVRVLAVLGALSGAGRDAHAAGNSLPKVTLSDLESSPELAEPAAALGLLLRSKLGPDQRLIVGRAELAAAIEAGVGSKPPALVVPGAAVTGILERLGADRLFAGQFRAETTHWEVRAQILGSDGQRLQSLRVDAPIGELDVLAGRLASRLARRLELSRIESPAQTLADLLPYVRAERALRAGDVAAATRQLSLAQPEVSSESSAAKEIVETIWRAPTVPVPMKLAVAPVAHDPGTARVLVDDVLERDPNNLRAAASKARLLAESGNLAGATRELDRLNKLPGATADPFVAVANAVALVNRRHDTMPAAAGIGGGAPTGRETKNDRAQRQEREKAEEKKDRQETALYLAIEDPGGDNQPVLAYMSGTDPGSFRPELEGRAVTAAHKVALKNPDLAAQIAVRGLLGGGDAKKLVPLVDPKHMSSAELRALEAKLVTLGPEGKAAASTFAAIVKKNSEAAEKVRLGGRSRQDLVTGVDGLAKDLGGVLGRLGVLEAAGGAHVIVLPRPGSEDAWWSPLVVRRQRLQTGFAAALFAAPYEMWLAAEDRAAVQASASEEALVAKLAQTGADFVLLYGSRGARLDVEIDVALFESATGETHRMSGIVAGMPHSLLRLNAAPLGIASGLLVLPIALLLLRKRGGAIRVRVLHEDAEDRALSIVISQSASAPRIPDKAAYEAELARRSAKPSRFFAANVDGVTTFARIPRGKWYVHLHGTYRTGKIAHVVSGGPFSQVIEIVKAGEQPVVVFSLAGDGAEYHVTVHDQKQPVVGAKVWIDDARDQAVATDPTGLAVIKVPLGHRIIRTEAGGMLIEKPYEVVKRKAHELAINLAWERRVDSVARVLDNDAE